MTTALLTINYASNSAIISWPFLPAGWMLQTNSDLTTTNWASYGGPISTNNGGNSITFTLPAGNLFFRLENP